MRHAGYRDHPAAGSGFGPFVRGRPRIPPRPRGSTRRGERFFLMPTPMPTPTPPLSHSTRIVRLCLRLVKRDDGWLLRRLYSCALSGAGTFRLRRTSRESAFCTPQFSVAPAGLFHLGRPEPGRCLGLYSIALTGLIHLGRLEPQALPGAVFHRPYRADSSRASSTAGTARRPEIHHLHHLTVLTALERYWDSMLISCHQGLRLRPGLAATEDATKRVPPDNGRRLTSRCRRAPLPRGRNSACGRPSR